MELKKVIENKNDSSLSVCEVARYLNCNKRLHINSTSYNLEWQSWVNENVGLLLSTTPYERCLKENVIGFLGTTGISLLRFSKELNLPHATIRNWIAGIKPILTDALLLSFKLGCTTSDILTKKISVFKLSNIEFSVERSGKNIIDIDKLKNAIDVSLNSDEVISLKKFSTNAGVSITAIKRNFPNEVSLLKAKYNNYLNECKEDKTNLLINTIKSLKQKGIYPSRKRIIKEVGRNILSDNYFHEIWRTTINSLDC
jgi:hypothetical protein